MPRVTLHPRSGGEGRRAPQREPGWGVYQSSTASRSDSPHPRPLPTIATRWEEGRGETGLLRRPDGVDAAREHIEWIATRRGVPALGRDDSLAQRQSHAAQVEIEHQAGLLPAHLQHRTLLV